MNNEFYKNNRKTLYDTLQDGTVLLSFAGKPHHQSADAYFPLFVNRNFVYLTGLDGAEPDGFILMAEKVQGEIKETLFILPADKMAERWSGRRLKPDEIDEMGGLKCTEDVAKFHEYFHRTMNSGRIHAVALDIWRDLKEHELGGTHKFAHRLQHEHPDVELINYHYQLRKQRTIKQPCEIETMKKALTYTKAGIEAMMEVSEPGMYEYQYKAAYDHALTSRGILSPAFPSIISAGENNFCIHYYGYRGQAQDGDMILNDVGASYDGICTDVSRGWPCNGVFSEKQRALYECAYKTSEYMFSIIKPGMAMPDVDKTIKEYCGNELIKIGLLDDIENVGKYMWHGGAHHVGYDVHDHVFIDGPIEAGMVFCVDVGIYVEEWGIGFRLEDNCLVTEDGCENLSADIPRTIDEIEAKMRS
ncbi:MAG: aminopeptidase P N-terminal domain-containing protein [Eubacteriales bacterium]